MRISAIFLTLVFSTTSMAADSPNFVWLISEDNSLHYLKHFFPTGAETPRISKLAAEGLTFQHAFSTAPVCSVARTTLITSCYAPRIGTQYHRRAVSVPMPAGLKMFPAYLRESGYYAVNNQKKDYNADESDGTWDESSSTATWRGRQPDQPFFFMKSFTTTHESSLHFDEATVNGTQTVTQADGVTLAPYHPDTPTFRYTLARYHDRIRQVDQEIGEVIDQLKNDGLLDTTFIFYFADHGGVLPRGKGYAYESGLHVPLVIRIPEKYRHLVDWQPGSRIEGFVSFVDFGPTLLHLAGAKYPEGLVDGRPFLGQGITAESVDKRDTAFGYADRFDEKYDLVRTMRVGKYEYVRSYQPFNPDGLHNNYRYNMLAYREWRELYKAGKLNSVQSQFFRGRPAELLFDIASDPHEVNNLATDPAHTDVLLELRRRMQHQVKSLPDLSFYPESYLAENAFDDPVAFGKERRAEIESLIDVADLSLVAWDEAEARVREAIASSDPWKRYWGLIVCSRFGKQAAALTDVASQLASSDPNLLVRLRASEFLGLTDLADPRPMILECLKQSQSGVELGLMLNSVVLLRDRKPGYLFRLNVDDFSPEALRTESVARRLEYLSGVTIEKKKNGKKKR